MRVAQFAILVAAFALPVGCAAEPRPEYRPYAIPIVLEAAPGTPLTGATTGPLPSDDPDDALRLRVSVLGLADAVRDVVESLDGSTVLVSVRPSEQPIEPAPSSERGVRLAAGAAADSLLAGIELGEHGRVDLLAEATAAVPRGVMTRLLLGRADDPTSALTFAVWREDAPRIAMLSRRPALPRDPLGDGEDDDRRGSAHAARTTSPDTWPLETSVLAPSVLPVGGRCVFLVPRPLPGWPDACLAVQLDLGAAPLAGDVERADHEAAMLLCIALCKESAEAVTTRSRVPATGLSGALAALGSPARRAPAIVYLASSTGARLAEDIALGSDPLLLADLARDLLAEPVTDAELGFRLERAAILHLARRAETGDLPPEQDALLALRTGQLARDPAVLTELVSQARDLPDLESLLLDENLAFLEDAEPSARVRAFDWLDARSLAPAGYDPLGSRDDRREALDLWVEQQVEAAEVEEVRS